MIFRSLTVFILAVFPVFSEKKRVFIRYGEGRLPVLYNPINEHLAAPAFLQQPLFSSAQFETLAPEGLNRMFSLKTKHHSIGFEFPFLYQGLFLRLGGTNSVYSGNPYDKFLSIYYFDRYISFQRRPDTPEFQFLMSLGIFSQTYRLAGKELNGIRYETNSLDFGVKYEYGLSHWFILTGGTDIGFGKCFSGTDSCRSYNISPFIGFNIRIWEVSLNLEVYRRFVWMDFGNSYTMNFEGSDIYAVSFYKEFDYNTEAQNQEAGMQ